MFGRDGTGRVGAMILAAAGRYAQKCGHERGRKHGSEQLRKSRFSVQHAKDPIGCCDQELREGDAFRFVSIE